MSTISNVGKIAYIYNSETDTWHPVAGMTDASADFSWSGDHLFAAGKSIKMNSPLIAAGGVNNFVSVADRASKITSPVDGTMAIVLVDGVMQFQYYYSGAWRLLSDNSFLQGKTASMTLSLADAGRTLEMNSASAMIVTIPLDSVVNFPIGSQMAFIQSGVGAVSFTSATDGTTTVSILSKNNNKKISARYSQAILVKKASNSWYLMGDLTA